MDIKNLIIKPEYIALFIAVLAIFVNVYIAYRNRKYALAKEKYFRLQQIVERITAKLLILNTLQEKLKTYVELRYKASKDIGSIFIDSNDTFNGRELFEEKGEEITALIDIYFEDIGSEWNLCLKKMSDLYTHVLILSKKLENNIQADWEDVVNEFNKMSSELSGKPNKIADKLKQKLQEFREKERL